MTEDYLKYLKLLERLLETPEAFHLFAVLNTILQQMFMLTSGEIVLKNVISSLIVSQITSVGLT